MKSLYVLSGASGMTGSELVRQILEAEKDSRIIGFDNFCSVAKLTLQIVHQSASSCLTNQKVVVGYLLGCIHTREQSCLLAIVDNLLFNVIADQIIFGIRQYAI